MRTTRRSVRTAVVAAGALATGAAVALALPAGAAFADSPAGAVAAAPGASSTGRTAKLADGSVARIHKLGPHHYKAEIRSGGTVRARLVTTGSPVFVQSKGLHVVLRPDGNVVSWLEGRKQAAAHAAALGSSRITTPDGRIARLVKGRDGGDPRAEVSMKSGKRIGTLTAEYPSARHAGWTYKLVPNGRHPEFVVIDGERGGSTWVYDFDGELLETYRGPRGQG
ncbi:hypothetical protein ACFU5O_15930 [Streptomyces sp. NPDC057445]|uniref:hypothetical protein n=1 Tax=Streptomyces sp. NPDC057445 TaxID=3346136 RepID=UPI0036942F51